MHARNLAPSPSSFLLLAFWGLFTYLKGYFVPQDFKAFSNHVSQQKFLVLYISHTQSRCVQTKKYPFPRKKKNPITPVLTCLCPQILRYFNHPDGCFTSVVSVTPCLPHC